jgi:hypothetical protein
MTMAIRIAAALYLVLGVGFGVGTVATLWHLERHGELPMTPFGFRSLAGGPFERLDSPSFKALGWSLVAFSVLDAVTGVWLWQGRRRGARLGLATSPITFALAMGFALPFLLVGVPLRAALVIIGRRRRR